MKGSGHKYSGVVAVFVLGMAYRLVCSLQGMDYVDTGFGSTYYQHIFTEPDALIYNYLYYVTGLIGGTWNMFCGTLGIYGFRICEVIFVAMTVGMLSVMYRREMSTKVLMLAIAMCFILPGRIATLHYNTLSYFFVVLSAVILYIYYRDRSWWMMLMCGFFVGVAFLVRIVNVALLGLIVIPVIADTGEVVAARMKRSATMLAGMLLGLLFTLCIMYRLGHTPYFLEALDDAFGILGRGGTTHSSGGLLYAYFNSVLNIVLQAAVMLLCGYLVLVRDRRWCSGKYWSWLAIAGFMVLVATNPPQLPFTTLCVVLLLPYLWTRRREYTPTDKVTLYLLVAALILPLGSDIGVSGVCNWTPGLLMFPACVASSKVQVPSSKFQVPSSKFQGPSSKFQGPSSRWVYQAFCFIALCAVLRNVVKPVGDDGTRFCQTTKIGGLLNVYVSDEKAEKYQHAIGVIEKYAMGNPYLVLANQQTELYYATCKIPLLGVTESHAYEGQRMHQRLAERSAYYRHLPVIAIINSIGKKKPETQAEILRWAGQHGYRTVYSEKGIKVMVTSSR